MIKDLIEAKVSRRRLVKWLGLGAAGSIVAACQPQVVEKVVTQIVEKEKIVEKKVEVPVEKRVEVTKIVEKEKIVEKQVMVTPTLPPPVTISLWWFDRSTINEMTKFVLESEFAAKEPWITVKDQIIPGAQMLVKLNTSVQAGNPPDVIYIDETFLPDLIEQKALHPIPPELFNVEKEMGAFTAFEMKMPDGKFYALPMGHFARSVYYNIEVLKKHKYEVKDIPNKWPELIRFAQTMTKWEGTKVVQSGFALTGFETSGAAVSMGGWLASTRKKHGYGQPPWQAAWEFRLDLLDKYKLDSRTNIPPTEFFGQNGYALMTMQTFYSGFLKNQFPGIKWGTLPKIVFREGTPQGIYEPDVGWAVTTVSKDPRVVDASWRLWSYMQSPGYMRRYCRFRGVDPTILSVQQEKQYSIEDVEWRGQATKRIPGNHTGDGYPDAVVWTPIGNIATRILNDAKNAADIKKIIAEESPAIDKTFAAYKHSYTMLSKEEWTANPQWSNGKIPMAKETPEDYYNMKV